MDEESIERERLQLTVFLMEVFFVRVFSPK